MTQHKNPYKPIDAEVIDIIDESPTIKSFVLKPAEPIPFKAGQFVELTLPGSGEAPFTPSSSPSQKETMEISIMKAGRVTGQLHDIPKGTTLGIRGPLGNGYPLDKFAGKQVYIVGGGVGLAPIRSLFLALVERKNDFAGIVCRYGARTPEDFIYKHTTFNEWPNIDGVNMKLTADQGNDQWKHNVGVVTTILSPDDVKINNSVAVVCGPPIMMKFVTLKLLEFGFKAEQIYLSMEKNMSCGIGMCGHCMIGKYYVCKDGPVFTYDQIKDYPKIWE
ncbi:MAG: FAD/NAD(P)-binding protein [Sedimentisphaerales bacterium]|nr:FAD/NAD(P)-binding protein [Sedimentisphaerales bacterium]